MPFLGRLVRLVAFVGFIAGLSQAIFAPRSASWRLPPIADETAVRLARYPLWIAGVFALARSIQAFFDIIGVGLSTTILIDGLAAALITLMFALTIRPVKAAEEEHASEHPAEPGQEFRLFGLLRLVAWVAVVIIVCALVLGYVSLGFFLATQLIWLSTLGAMLYILMALVDDLFTGWGPTSAVSRFARGAVGLRSESFDQICALVSGLLRLILIVIAIMLAAAPWGIQSGDATSWIRRALAGITFGGFSLSPGAILGAIAFIAGGLLLTRAVQRWLDTSYLPRTRLDDGLKNSIRTATGYAGTILAIGLAVSSLGFGLDRIAIVAGALSVGIGFGLQSIVSNFVSGLILLAERPIKVGDWVGIGPDEGNVRRISVRSTVIELFDRSTLIVPNSDLITKSVRNRTHSNPLGRVSLQVGTAHEAPVAEIKQILLASASEIAGVLKTPAPEVLITGTTDVGVQWTLICAVATPRQVAATLQRTVFCGFATTASEECEDYRVGSGLIQPFGGFVKFLSSAFALLSCAVVSGGLLAACSTSSYVPDQKPTFYRNLSAPGSEVDGVAAASMISGYRANKGLGPVVLDPTLNKLAKQHAVAMARKTKVGHDVGDGPLDKRAKEEGYAYARIAENVAGGYQNSRRGIFRLAGLSRPQQEHAYAKSDPYRHRRRPGAGLQVQGVLVDGRRRAGHQSDAYDAGTIGHRPHSVTRLAVRGTVEVKSRWGAETSFE